MLIYLEDMSTINSHGEEIFRDGEPREASPGSCPSCGTDRKVCGDCGRWLACEGTCGDPADCTCPAEAAVEAADDEEETASIPVETMQQLVFRRAA